MTVNLSNYQGLPEAPVSLNFSASIRGYAVQLTLRGEDEANTLDRFDRLVDILEGEYGVSAPGKPGELAFEATQLVPNVNDGTVYWKVKGGRFQKWGVTIWPEVLEKAGFVVEELDPINGRDLEGWVAVYVLDEEKGHPKKVVELRQSGEIEGNAPSPDYGATTVQIPIYDGMERAEFFAVAAQHLKLDAMLASKLLIETGKYTGGFSANPNRVVEMWQDLVDARKNTITQPV